MSSPGGPTGVRRIAVYVLSLALLLLGTVGVWVAAGRPSGLDTPFSVPWWTLVPAYALASKLTIEYEFRKESRQLLLTQLPLALGLVFVAPWLHLVARVVASVVHTVGLNRHKPMKALFNIALSVCEVGVAAVVFALLTRGEAPSSALWVALYVALLVGDLVAQLAMTVVLGLAGVPQRTTEVAVTLAACAATTSVFAGIAIISVAAVWTEPTTSAVIGLLAFGLGLAYRGHRRLAAQQQQNLELYRFVKELGPLDLDAPTGPHVLEQVRLLLHAHHLQLSLKQGDGWVHYRSDDAESAPIEALDADQTLSTASRMRAGMLGPDDHMATPLFGTGDVMGVLSVRQRLGSVRGFEIRDVRLLETVATELASALERGRLHRDLESAATTDPLTGLPNLNELSRLLDEALETAPAGLLVAAVAVDSFREVNDTLGHQVGDELLLEVTRRLRLGYGDAIIGRIGGGRFTLAVPADRFGHDPSMFGLGLRAQVEGGAQLGPVGTHVKLSVGCVRAPEHGDDAATLIRRAETAMYSARHAHGGPVVWEPVYEIQGQRRLAVVMALREAISSGAIGVAFQPKVSASGRAVTGVEALARWTHPALGAISPAEFVPLAEAAGLMGNLTSLVLRQALTACKGWQRRAGRIGVAVNVSADTVLDPAFVTEVAALLTSTNVSPDLLTLELTEGVVVDDPQLAAERMTELRALGIKISVDDFGTGYSSLTYLKGLPVDEVKVDKGFVDHITSDAGDRAVVRAVVDIAHTLGLSVVAEGVEQEDQRAMLRDLGVDELQGYLFARPMAALDMAQWLRRQDSPHEAPRPLDA